MGRTRRRELLGGLGAASLGALAGCPTPWRPDPVPDPGDGGRSLATRDGILHVDDEPFVPTGVYYWPDVSAPRGRNPFEDVAAYGLDAVTARYQYVRLDGDRVPGQPDLDRLRAEAERLGLYYLLESPPPSELAGKSDRELESLFGSLADRVAGSPHFLGWTFDEPAWRGIDLETVRRAVAAIEAHPVEQVVYFVYAPVDGRWSDPDWPDMTAYSAEADVVGHTFYPVDPGLPWEGYVGRSRLEDYGWYTDRIRSWVDADVPVWLHQQGHRVGDLADPPTDEGRRPTRVETRFMSFQALVHGASGVFYFPGSKLGGAIPFDAPVWDRYIRETAAEVRALRDVVASSGSGGEVTSSSPDVRTLAGRRDGKRVILAVREADGPPESVRLDLARDGRFRVRGEGRTVDVEDGTLRDTFGGYDVNVYVERRGDRVAD